MIETVRYPFPLRAFLFFFILFPKKPFLFLFQTKGRHETEKEDKDPKKEMKRNEKKDVFASEGITGPEKKSSQEGDDNNRERERGGKTIPGGTFRLWTVLVFLTYSYL